MISEPIETVRVQPADQFEQVAARENSRRGTFGIKAKLFLAFCAMAGFTISAAAIAWYAFVTIERSVERITAESIPAMTVSLRLAEKSEEIAAAAPALIASADQAERVLAQTRLKERSRELTRLTHELEVTGVERETVEALSKIQEQITTGLVALNEAVEKRLRLNEQRETASTGIAAAHGQLIEVLEPLVDDAVFDLIISGEDLTAKSTEVITGLVEGGVGAIHQLLTVNAELNLAAGLLTEAANTSDSVLIQPIRERFLAAAATVERSMDEMSDLVVHEALRRPLNAFLAFGSGEDNIFDLRQRELRAIVAERATIELKRERMAETLKAAHSVLLDILTPIIDDATFDLVTHADDVTTQNAEAITNLIDGGVNTLQVLLALRAEGNLAAGLLAEAVNISDHALIQPIRERFIAASYHIEQQLDQLPDQAESQEVREKLDRLIAFGVGDDGIFSIREEELSQIATAENLLQVARSLTIRLGDQVTALVAAEQSKSDQAARQASQAISDGELVLLMITSVSVVGGMLIVLFYVTPRVIKPLENITTAMTELAAGDTSVNIPARERRDEIGHMAQALGVFRDTAIEVQKSNLREIRETRRRLTDAIETISEGFSLYDKEDRLVVCNSMYRTLLYPNIEDEITTGMTFESIVRRAADQGYIEDAKGRLEEWLEQRLVRHRDPGGPHVQERADGRWIMVSERKTEDGGTVAVYSDISELKQREKELADKSSALEQLSNQLAKYLSPQVYESIFSGRQEVKIESARKKLTVFFSDIAGFTETADKLESEDLTKLLNHYLTEMSQIAMKYGATIDKYVGDAIVIFFGDPETGGVKEDALACVKMAIAMRKRMLELGSIWRDSGIEKPLQVRIGINTGYCTVGNFGSEDRMDYTIIGGGVNLASRLESAATPGEILISYETYAYVKDQIECEERGEINVKGIAHLVATYQVVDTYNYLGKHRQLIREHLPNLKLDLDLDAMSINERSRATTVLQRALDRLSSLGTE
jgi:class 3 adenylate cyclase/phosphoglycerate-specific signal transduction histidine kinase